MLEYLKNRYILAAVMATTSVLCIMGNDHFVKHENLKEKQQQYMKLFFGIFGIVLLTIYLLGQLS